MADSDGGLFPALLKHWRSQRGLSQLDLALAADVSSRHVSFLETGRSNPSPEMVVQLGSTLGVPLRQINEMLRAAGHDPVYDESEGELPTSIRNALKLLKEHHEPYPLVVVDRVYRVWDVNEGGRSLLQALLGAEVPNDLNLATVTFDPEGAHPLIVNFDEVGRELLWRVQREVLADPSDGALRNLLDDLLAMPTVDPQWRSVDLSIPAEPMLVVHLRADDLDLHFVTMVTSFQVPQNVLAESLRIETWLPADDATAAVCRMLADVGRTD